MRTLIVRAIRVVGQALVGGLWRWSPSRDLLGIRTAIFADSGVAEVSFQRINSALGLIQRHHPPTFDRIRTQVRGILGFGTEHYRLAHWDNAARLCVVTVHYLQSADTTPSHLALTLAHESMHARLSALGAKYADGRRAHLEVICAMAELALARRLPDSALHVERVQRLISNWASAGEAEWSNETMRSDELTDLRAFGVPRWLISLVSRVERFLSRRAA